MDRFPSLLAATAMGVYLLLVIGATTAVTDASAACVGWPLCGGELLPASTDGLLALGHRAVAAAVGLLVLASGVTALRVRPDYRVSGALALAAVLFPLQAGFGAFVATAGGETVLATVAGVALVASTLHLLVGLAIFGGLLAALAWELERRTGDPDDAPADPPSGPSDADALPVDDGTAPPIPAWTDAPLRRARLTATAYYRLTKPRLMWLLCLVAGAGMALAAGPDLSVRTVALTLGGGVLAIGASGTFNHVLERDRDKRMARTADRP
ncbi:MAG: UbiA family prenyltransferase, partial [Halobaculum sp.]